jgi:hypothetical protein
MLGLCLPSLVPALQEQLSHTLAEGSSGLELGSKMPLKRLLKLWGRGGEEEETQGLSHHGPVW